MTGRRHRVAAAVAAVVYIGVQAFQAYVYAVLPAAATSAEELVQGAETLHVARSVAMLLAMFGLVFIYTVIALQRIRTRPVQAGFAIACFFLFGLLEIGLRSVELFWTQIQLPAAYASSHDPAILDQLATFQSVQAALYFPLQLSTLIGSVVMFVMFAPPPRIHWVIRAAFALNIARIAARMATSYLAIPLLPTAFYEQVYFVLVVLFYAPVAYWLFALRSDDA